MNKYLTLLLVFAVSKSNKETPATETLLPPVVDNTVSVGVPEADQIKYIRKLALYHLNKAKWSKRFDDTSCPEIIITLPIDKNLCGEHCKEIILNPEPPLTLCQYRPDYPGCKEGGVLNPDCEKNPKLCLPPRYCDLFENSTLPECLETVEEDCKVGDDRKWCRWATRCDNDEYKDLPNCKMINPCQADPTLCYTICDHASYKNTTKC